MSGDTPSTRELIRAVFDAFDLVEIDQLLSGEFQFRYWAGKVATLSLFRGELKIRHDFECWILDAPPNATRPPKG